MASDWFICKKDGNRVGPYSSQQLRGLANEGKLHPDDYVWREGLSKPARARQLQGLFQSANPATRLPPPVGETERRPTIQSLKQARLREKEIPQQVSVETTQHRVASGSEQGLPLTSGYQTEPWQIVGVLATAIVPIAIVMVFGLVMRDSGTDRLTAAEGEPSLLIASQEASSTQRTPDAHIAPPLVTTMSEDSRRKQYFAFREALARYRLARVRTLIFADAFSQGAHGLTVGAKNAAIEATAVLVKDGSIDKSQSEAMQEHFTTAILQATRSVCMAKSRELETSYNTFLADLEQHVRQSTASQDRYNELWTDYLEVARAHKDALAADLESLRTLTPHDAVTSAKRAAEDRRQAYEKRLAAHADTKEFDGVWLQSEEYRRSQQAEKDLQESYTAEREVFAKQLTEAVTKAITGSLRNSG